MTQIYKVKLVTKALVLLRKLGLPERELLSYHQKQIAEFTHTYLIIRSDPINHQKFINTNPPKTVPIVEYH